MQFQKRKRQARREETLPCYIFFSGLLPFAVADRVRSAWQNGAKFALLARPQIDEGIQDPCLTKTPLFVKMTSILKDRLMSLGGLEGVEKLAQITGNESVTRHLTYITYS